MPSSDIVIRGAREHNLRDVNVVLPRNQLVCLTGVSGSGKSSLAFDTVYAEGQRRYVESLSSFARQFLGQMPKPDVDFIGGLSPSISISQKSAGTNPRSTVGTITEIYDYLRVLYARVGDGFCPQCSRPITAQSREQILARILSLPQDTAISILAPVIRGQKGEYRDLFEEYLKQGFVRARVDGQVVSLSSDPQLDRQMRHDIEIVIDRLQVKPTIRGRLSEAVETALKIGKGNLFVSLSDDRQASSDQSSAKATPKKKRRGRTASSSDIVLSVDYACTHCGVSFEPPSPQLFSFNSPQGMCLECDGLGEIYSFDVDRLIPDPTLSFHQGCFELLGPWKQLGRWRRHIYRGVAETFERVHELPAESMLKLPWQDLSKKAQHAWLWGTGDLHITFTWRGGKSPMKYGGNFDGIIPQLLDKYRNSKSRMQIRRLEQYMSTIDCPDCLGRRLNAQACSVTLTSAHPQFVDQPTRSLPDVCEFSVSEAIEFFRELELDETRGMIATEALKEVRGRLGFLQNVGLDYLSLNRTAPTLSGGESQRIRLAGQIGCGLVGVLYILDEPSIGLHPRDNDRLIETLCDLRDLGNTVVVVEHDEDTMRASDHVIDFGPGPGIKGGEVVAEGPLERIERTKRSVTGQYLSGKQKIAVPVQRRLSAATEPIRASAPTEKSVPPKRRGTAETKPPVVPGKEWLTVVGASHNNLKGVDVSVPLGTFVCITGVSGSGKSSLVGDILVEALRRDLNGGDGDPGEYAELLGLHQLDKMIAIDQSPIGRTPRSNPGTYIKLFDDIRNLFTQLPLAKQRGYKPGRFSFNVDGGRCPACEGNGSTKLEMDFLADVWVTCPVCQGHRFNRETLAIKFKDYSIADVLEMDVQQALSLFENIPKVKHKLQTLQEVGLDYLKIGQPSPTLSGGEAQRIKLARELVKRSTGRTLYMLDEPTTGLHFADIQLLLKVLHDFVDSGNTVVVVEHNLDVIKTADWIIDLGPEGGTGGGEIVAAGTPEEIASCQQSHTGRALSCVLDGKSSPVVNRAVKRKTTKRKQQTRLAKQIELQGARQHNLKGIDLKVPRDQMSIFCGPSGSGKSSLAMDTIYAEGQRRYVESLSSYARQFVSQMQKPQLERIEGLSPAIAIEQQNLGSTPRSTVGTSTEIYDYLRILMARLGTPHCPDCEIPVGTQTPDQVVDKIMAESAGTRLLLMAPVRIETGQSYDTLWSELQSNGYHRVRVDGQTFTLDEPPSLNRRRKYQIEVVVDRIVVRQESRGRIAESVEGALSLGHGVMHVAYPNPKLEEIDWPTRSHSQHRVCESCGRSFDELTPHSFSFNSHLGWCEACEGLGTETGANPAALIRSQQMTLAEGTILLWPNIHRDVSQWMLTSLSSGTGIPLDVAIGELDTRQRRRILHGTGDKWFPVYLGGKPRKKSQPPLFEFQFKGLYPALEEAAKLSPSLRSRLEHLVDDVECSACGGSRVRADSAAVRFFDQTIDQLCRQPLGQLQSTIKSWKLTRPQQRVAGELLREIRGRVQFLNDVGLEYLTLNRSAATLSGGEAQRIRLASQLGSGLCGVLYVLDEPTIGLHPRDNHRLLTALHKLRDLGNTLILVEHDREVIAGGDHVVDFGPGAGRHGGEVIAQGTPEVVSRRRASVTGPYLSGKKAIPIPSNRRITDSNAVHVAHQEALREGETESPHTEKRKPTKARKKQKPTTPQQDVLTVVNACHNNLQGLDVSIPLGALTAITGVSGSGKSSLINDVLYAELARVLHRASTVSGAHDRLVGLQHINKVVRVDQHPLGNSPTSNPATYTGVFELIRLLFAQLPDAKLRGYSPRRFSFNVPGGRCDECEGNGQICIEMHFLPDVWVPCEACQGKRYNRETLEVRYRGHSIADVLEMTCADALELFDSLPKIRRIVQTLCDVGLDYLTLGQAAPTLSGGEAQRVKLAAELARPDTGRTLYLLDEPTTGLHFDDLAKLLNVLNRLVDVGNTVVVIEHNLDVIKTADWVIDIGPEAGDQGGYITAAGTPEEIVAHAQAVGASRAKKNGRRSKRAVEHVSLTGLALAPVLKEGPYETRTVYNPITAEQPREGDLDITDVGKQAKMPWQVDGRAWHTRDRVGRKGEPCRWNGRILSEIVDRIQKSDGFGDTNWNARTIVEIAGETKSHGWFLHAITGESWLLKLKFRVAKNTFRREEITRRFDLKPLNQMDELPVYGNEPRVRAKAIRGPWQEIEFRVHSWNEVDTPEFWNFLEQAIEGFRSVTQKAALNIEDHMPWKKLGKKWHLSRRGFPVGKKVKWNIDLLDQLLELLADVASEHSEFLWNNQQLVHLYVPEHKVPWATVHTKRTESLDLALTGPKSLFSLGRITELGDAPSVDAMNEAHDQIKLCFHRHDQLGNEDLRAFLQEHLDSVRAALST